MSKATGRVTEKMRQEGMKDGHEALAAIYSDEALNEMSGDDFRATLAAEAQEYLAGQETVDQQEVAAGQVGKYDHDQLVFGELLKVVECGLNRLRARLLNLAETSTRDKQQAEAMKGLIKDFCNLALDEIDPQVWVALVRFGVPPQMMKGDYPRSCQLTAQSVDGVTVFDNRPVK